jgi:Neuronal voltage-dependent calcium channel alpha 2acd
VIDNNGYILISEDNPEDSGRFFGEIEGAIMEVMVKEKVFDRITVYDYQALCERPINDSDPNSASSLTMVSKIFNLKKILSIYRRTQF